MKKSIASSPETCAATRHPVTAMALIVTLGIVFGDIGTSPLYVMKTILHVNTAYDPAYDIGAVSCVFWTLTLQTTLKYVVIALHADNKGEGGILALFSSLKNLRWRWLYVVAIVGASTLIADGIITPAITVTTAIEGLRVFNPHAPVVALTLLIIIAIFVIQYFGTQAIGRFFGPVMLLWFLMLGVVGAANIWQAPTILNAFNPYYAVRLLVDYPGWFLVLGAVFLCTTGAEALYSDLGHCGRRNITIAWGFAKVMLVLNYLGQGAWILSRPAAQALAVNPFYGMMPTWFVAIGIVMSTLAAIIASQALLSGSFTLFSEAMHLDFFPRIAVKYPTRIKGQLFIPMVNAFLFVGCVTTVLMFRDSSHMEAAYGLAITVTMLMTTVLLAFWLHTRGVKRWVSIAFAGVFLVIEGCFFVANASKFMHGGWFTVLIAGIVAAVMLIWYAAVRIRRRYVAHTPVEPHLTVLDHLRQDREVPLWASNLVYMTNSTNNHEVERTLIYSIINKQPKRADRYWLVYVDFTDQPDTLTYDYEVLMQPCALIRVNIHLGFRVCSQVSVYFRQIVEDLQRTEGLDLTSSLPSLRQHGIAGNFRFVIINRIFSPSSSCGRAERVVMKAYGHLRRIALPLTTALGLDTSNVDIEAVPLIINTSAPKRRITPVGAEAAD